MNNEQECLDFCIERLKGYDIKPIEERIKIRRECEDHCGQYGFSGVNMDMLWNRALLFARMKR